MDDATRTELEAAAFRALRDEPEVLTEPAHGLLELLGAVRVEGQVV